MNLESELSKAPFLSESHVGNGKAHTCPAGQWFSRRSWTNSIGMCLWEMQILRLHPRPSQQGSLGLMPMTLCANKSSRWVWEPLLWRSEQWLTLAFRLEYPTLINPPLCARTQLTFLVPVYHLRQQCQRETSSNLPGMTGRKWLVRNHWSNYWGTFISILKLLFIFFVLFCFLDFIKFQPLLGT